MVLPLADYNPDRGPQGIRNVDLEVGERGVVERLPADLGVARFGRDHAVHQGPSFIIDFHHNDALRHTDSGGSHASSTRYTVFPFSFSVTMSQTPPPTADPRNVIERFR